MWVLWVWTNMIDHKRTQKQLCGPCLDLNPHFMAVGIQIVAATCPAPPEQQSMLLVGLHWQAAPRRDLTTVRVPANRKVLLRSQRVKYCGSPCGWRKIGGNNMYIYKLSYIHFTHMRG